jgi:hypothetical protein
MLTRRAIAVAVVLTVPHVTAAQILAQTAPPSSEVRRPYRGLFGAPSSSDSPQSLIASASVFAAYDDNVVEGLTNRRVGSPRPQRSGTYQGANAALRYAFEKDGERFDFRGQTGAQVSFFLLDERSDVLPAYQASVEFGARLTRSLSFAARQNVGYSSTYSSTLAPRLDEDLGNEIGVADDVDLALFDRRAVQSATSLNLSQRFGQYASLGASYQLRARTSLDNEPDESPFRDYVSHTGTVGFQYARPMTRNATLRLGYGIRVTDRRRAAGEPDVMHNIDVGVDYSRALSFSRRTSFSFGSGSSIAVSDELPAVDGERRVLARLTGNVALAHEIGRSWTADVRYSRGFRTREGFDQLYFTDALTTSIGGLVTRRLQLAASATWAESSIGDETARRQSNRSAAAQATCGITSFLAAYARYVYVNYRFDEGIALDERFPRQLDRHGVRVGLTASVPLIR